MSEATAPAQTVGLNDFAKRQTAASRFSHFGGSEAELTDLVARCLPHAKPGNRDGVLVVPVPTSWQGANFFSGVVVVTDRMGLVAHWVRRAEGEDPYIEITAPGVSKEPARSVSVVVYRRDVLLAGGRVSTAADWEIVSVNARAGHQVGAGGVAGDEPPTPLSMARNHLEKPGGSKATYTPDEYAQAILYWSRRVHVGEDPDRQPLEGPEFPPLKAAVLKTDHCHDWAEAICYDWTFLPPPELPEPARPMTLALRKQRLKAGRVPEDGLEWARSVYYWSRRPRRESDVYDDM